MTLQAFDVRGVWGAVLPGLEEIHRLTSPEWRPEDLYAGCVSGRMHLFKPDATGNDFVLLTRNVSGYSGKAYLLVVAAFSKDGDAVAKFQSEIEDIARESGCAAIEFCSPRKGWNRLAGRHGFAEVTRVYRRNL
jgi:hypothetical protein